MYGYGDGNGECRIRTAHGVCGYRDRIRRVLSDGTTAGHGPHTACAGYIEAHGHGTNQPPRRHHPHVPEVRPEEHSQSHAAAARRGLRRHGAHAGLRQHAGIDRGGVGPAPCGSIPARSPAWGRAWRRCWRCCGSGSGRSWPPTRRGGCRRRRPGEFRRLGGRMQAARRAWSSRSARPSREEQLYDLERLVVSRGDEQSPFARAAGATDRPPGRQVPGRRAGGQVRVHRPHAP